MVCIVQTILLAVISVLLASLLLIPFYIDIEYVKNAAENKTKIVFKFLGIKFTLKPHRKKESPPDSRAEKEKKDFSLEKFKDSFDLWLTRFKAVKEDIGGVLDYLQKKPVNIDDLSLTVIFGFDDAAVNGIMTGVLNGVAYNILGFACRHITIKKHRLSLNPDFYAKRFDINLKCILKLKGVHIIIVVIKLLKIYFKDKKTILKHTEGEE